MNANILNNKVILRHSLRSDLTMEIRESQNSFRVANTSKEAISVDYDQKILTSPVTYLFNRTAPDKKLDLNRIDTLERREAKVAKEWEKLRQKEEDLENRDRMEVDKERAKLAVLVKQNCVLKDQLELQAQADKDLRQDLIKRQKARDDQVRSLDNWSEQLHRMEKGQEKTDLTLDERERDLDKRAVQTIETEQKQTGTAEAMMTERARLETWEENIRLREQNPCSGMPAWKLRQRKSELDTRQHELDEREQDLEMWKARLQRAQEKQKPLREVNRHGYYVTPRNQEQVTTQSLFFKGNPKDRITIRIKDDSYFVFLRKDLLRVETLES